MQDVEDGMTLAIPVAHPQNAAQTLLRNGFALDSRSIRRLNELHIEEIWIECPGLELIGRYIDPEIMRAHSRVSGAISGAMRDFASEDGKLDLTKFREALKLLMNTLVHNPRAALFMRELGQGDNPLLDHSTNTCFLSLLMGLRVAGYLVNQRKMLPPRHAKNVTALAVGAMLHDVGLLRMDPEIYTRWRHDQNDADLEWRQHAEIGFKLVQGNVEPSAANVVLHHHQRYDGRGFPRVQREQDRIDPLEGDTIHIFSRIVAAADWYDRLRRPANGAIRPQVRVHNLMQGPGLAGAIDPIIYRSLLSVAPPYPPGTIVKLNDGQTVVVTALCPQEPCRPVVQRLEGDIGDHELQIGEEMCLRDHQDLWIESVDGVNVTSDNFFANGSQQFDVLSYQSHVLHGEVDADAA